MNEFKRLGQDGFSLVELMVALVILAIGVLGLAGVTAYTIQNVTVAELETERGAALQSTVERLRSMPVDSLTAGSDTVGLFAVEWNVTDNTTHSTVEIVTVGPGRTSASRAMPAISGEVADTFTYIVTGQ